jgi:ATP-binding cassette subfamily F protein 3
LVTSHRPLSFADPPEMVFEDLMTLTGIGHGYLSDDETSTTCILFKNVTFTITPNSRIALVGPNGCGKSTIMKIMAGEIDPLFGVVKSNPKLRIGRFTQHHIDQLDMKKSVMQFFMDEFNESNTQMVTLHLASFGVASTTVMLPIYSLSGGQKSRVAFAHMMWSKPNLLLLDEVIFIEISPSFQFSANKLFRYGNCRNTHRHSQ